MLSPTLLLPFFYLFFALTKKYHYTVYYIFQYFTLYFNEKKVFIEIISFLFHFNYALIVKTIDEHDDVFRHNRKVWKESKTKTFIIEELMNVEPIEQPKGRRNGTTTKRTMAPAKLCGTLKWSSGDGWIRMTKKIKKVKWGKRREPWMNKPRSRKIWV